MVTINVDEARAQLPALLDRVMAGEEVVLTRGGQHVARLVVVNTVEVENLAARTPADAVAEDAPVRVRQGGFLRGQIWIADDSDETSQELIDLFECGPVFPEDEDNGSTDR